MANELIIQLGHGSPQPRRLLDTIERFVVPGDNPDRWLDGVKWEPKLCRALTVDAEDVCTADTLDVTPATCVEFITQVPFRISDAMQYSTLDTTFEEMGPRLEAAYNMKISAAFATELVSGAASSGLSLSSEATAPNGAAFGDPATPIWNALAILEEEIAERLRGEVGFIFLPPGLLAQAVESYGLTLQGDRWATPVGNVVISDAGLIAPIAPTGEAASAAAEDWVYASGGVWFQSTSPTLIGGHAERFLVSGGRSDTAFDRNTLVQYVAGYGILVFDPCPVTAVLVSYAMEG